MRRLARQVLADGEVRRVPRSDRREELGGNGLGALQLANVRGLCCSNFFSASNIWQLFGKL